MRRHIAIGNGHFFGAAGPPECATIPRLQRLEDQNLVAVEAVILPAPPSNTLKLRDYAIHIEPLSREEGGGFLVTVPDLPGCVVDGETVDAAIAEAHDAFKAWAAAEQQDQGALPIPKYSGQFVLCIPKSLHQRLATRAAAEGVSLNQLAATYLAHGLAEGSGAEPQRSDGR